MQTEMNPNAGWPRAPGQCRGDDISDKTQPAALLTDPTVLVDALIADGWRVIGPRQTDGAIVYVPLGSGADLPKGLTDDQQPASYRLRDGDPARWFDYVVGPQNWKKWLFPARQKLWSARKTSDGFAVEAHDDPWPKTVLFGVRPCDLAAIEILDRVFDNPDFTDPGYRRRRDDTFIVTVQCARAAPTCFCTSMNTGPRASGGFDIALTELGADGDGAILVECGSERGAAVLTGLDTDIPEQRHHDAADAATQNAKAGQSRRMTGNIPRTLRDNPEHPHWEKVADRCLSCANCTLACPTCFCSDVEDVNDLSGAHTERWRSWDSCFTGAFSYIHGGTVRRSTKSRYRQWMTHKLSSWHDQFGSSGCVGCGRCIAWCPVGIDITAEAAALSEPAPAKHEE